MVVGDLKKAVNSLFRSADMLLEKKISVEGQSGDVFDFSQQQAHSHRRSYFASIARVQDTAASACQSLDPTVSHEVMKEVTHLQVDDPSSIKQSAERLAGLLSEIKSQGEIRAGSSSGLPTEIKADITADLDEINRCFSAGCYRSVVILCGRILEVALHRKYYEATGVDALEKSPGIGLGNLIAKMRDKNVHLDPGLAQQIHLVNQVRVFSVHKKQQAFTPSREQAQAMILCTNDILNKFFKLS